MSVRIACDRCGKDTRLYFLNAKVEIRRGGFASVNSKVSGADRALPFYLDWHLCESCASDLKCFKEAPPQAA